MVKRRFIFFDVGNTLLFPNRARMLAPVAAEKHPSLQAWQALERRTKQEFDQGLISGNTLIANTQNSANWDQILPGTREALDRIAERYAIAVISNADGRIDAVLDRCGICDCFASITDSGNVGHEKPHPAIFAAALQQMKADPAESLYVGDVYSVDYVGALNAGMDAVLFDVAGAYRGGEFPRVESLAELEGWLAK